MCFGSGLALFFWDFWTFGGRQLCLEAEQDRSTQQLLNVLASTADVSSCWDTATASAAEELAVMCKLPHNVCTVQKRTTLRPNWNVCFNPCSPRIGHGHGDCSHHPESNESEVVELMTLVPDYPETDCFQAVRRRTWSLHAGTQTENLIFLPVSTLLDICNATVPDVNPVHTEASEGAPNSCRRSFDFTEISEHLSFWPLIAEVAHQLISSKGQVLSLEFAG